MNLSIAVKTPPKDISLSVVSVLYIIIYILEPLVSDFAQQGWVTHKRQKLYKNYYRFPQMYKQGRRGSQTQLKVRLDYIKEEFSLESWKNNNIINYGRAQI